MITAWSLLQIHSDAGPVDPRLDHSVGRRVSLPGWIAHPGKNWIRAQPTQDHITIKSMLYNHRKTLTDGSGWTGVMQ